MSLWLVVAAGVFIAYVNGANDISKGIATLVGGSVSNYRRAILWGTLWTGIGGLAAFSVAKALLTTFGKGVFAAGTTPTFPVALAIILGAGTRVALATLTGLPVSTTHAIVGAMSVTLQPRNLLVSPEDEFNRTLIENVHPPAWTNPKPSGRYNLVVVGAGTMKEEEDVTGRCSRTRV